MRDFDYVSGTKIDLKPRWHTPCFDNLNKLDWTAGFGITCHGVKVGIRCNNGELIPSLLNRLPSMAKPVTADQYDAVLSLILGRQKAGSRVRSFHLAYHNHTRVGRSHNLDDVLDRYEGFLSLSVAMLAPRKVFVHAGTVAWKGRAIVIPGVSYSGKSTLVMELVKAGATYLSDEFAVLDEAGRVRPWPKPISMRRTSDAKQIDIDVKDIDGRIGKHSYPIGVVFDTAYVAGGRWRPKALSPGEGILKLLVNCPGGRIAPQRVMRRLERASHAAAFLSSQRGEAKDLVPSLLEAAERETGS